MIGSDGSVSREFRFRSQSSQRSPETESEKVELVKRQQSEPVKEKSNIFSSTTNIDINQNIEKAESEIDPVTEPDCGKSPKLSESKHPTQKCPSLTPKPNNTLDDKISKAVKVPEWKIDQVIRKMSAPLIDSKAEDEKENYRSNQANTELNTHTFENKAFINIDAPPKKAEDINAVLKDKDCDKKDELPLFENKAFIEVSCGSSNSERTKPVDKKKKISLDIAPKKKSVMEETFDIIAEGEKTISSILNDQDEVKPYSPVYKKEREELFKTTNVSPEKEPDAQVYKSSVDFELNNSDPPTFYKTSVPKSTKSDKDSISGSMLDFCISRDTMNTKPDSKPDTFNKLSINKSNSLSLKNRPQIRPSLHKPPSGGRNKKSYNRSKSYAGVAGGVVSLTQCPLCARQFEK